MEVQKKSWLQSVALLMWALALTAVGLAQEITGTIRGTVADSTGAVISGAIVKVTNTDTHAVLRTLTTSTSGDYVATLLPVGRYSLAVTAPNFKKVERSGIELNVNDHLSYNFTLQPGAPEQVVNVESEPLQVQLEDATSAGLINGTQIRELSINNRNYEQLVALQPGVSSGVSDQIYIGVSNPTGLSNQINFSVNGNRPTQNNWTIDGADNVDRGANLTLLNYPSVDSIAEFKVLRGEYNPEFGRSSAGEVNVITRSGTSAFHGGVYEFFRNDVLNANGFSAPATSLQRFWRDVWWASLHTSRLQHRTQQDIFLLLGRSASRNHLFQLFQFRGSYSGGTRWHVSKSGVFERSLHPNWHSG